MFAQFEVEKTNGIYLDDPAHTAYSINRLVFIDLQMFN